MNRIRESLAAKTAAFIIIILCTAVLVMSGIVITVNLDNQWYSKESDEVEEDICYQLAVDVNYKIADSVYYEYGDLPDSESNEIIQGESESSALGYIVTSTLADEYQKRVVNRKLVKSKEAMKYDFIHDNLKIQVYLNVTDISGLPAELRNNYLFKTTLYEYRNSAIAAAAASMIAAVICFIFLMAAAGYSKKSIEENDGRITDRIPVEVFGAAAAVITVCAAAALDINGNDAVTVVVLTVCFSAVAAAWLGFIVASAVEIRHHTFKESSIIYRLIVLVKKALKWICRKIIFILQGIPLVWKSTLILLAGIIINFIIVIMICNSYNPGPALFIWFSGAAVTLAAGIYMALCMRKLREAAHHLAEGDLEYQVDKKGLFLDLAKHAEDLNSIGQGMSRAVEEKMKSERFKTELITNVSHDIKTPLTSIINYVDLLKKEEIDNEKAAEYIEVLDRQSSRMKKLIEDLVEASKAATGAMKLNMEKCQIDVLMMQVSGEYSEKAEKADLNIISRLPDEKFEIMADGRSMWRIFDNLMNNICKYSQPGTRVYQILERRGDKAVITYKNTSRYELDITAEELMERFVRGDRSRNTEGSGLGLSIARNLTELNGGNFDISIDGDLFKVVLKFSCK
ncbi:MAG: sensor histidine kinase [Lentihominibacter sp.]